MPPKMRTIQELRRELELKERKLAKVLARREKAMRRVAAIDAVIVALGGEIPGTEVKRRGRKPGRPASVPVTDGRKIRRARGRAKGRPLIQYMLEVLKDSEGMRIRDLMAAVQKAGYRSSSKDFYNIVAAAIRGDQFRKIGRGVYKLA